MWSVTSYDGKYLPAAACMQTYTPEPVDDLELFIQLHHEDDKEDDGKDHLTNSHRWVSAIQRCCVADEADQAQELQKDTDKEGDENGFRYTGIWFTNIVLVVKHLVTGQWDSCASYIQRKVLSALFHIRMLTGTHDYILSLWLGEISPIAAHSYLPVFGCVAHF